MIETIYISFLFSSSAVGVYGVLSCVISCVFSIKKYNDYAE